MVLAHSIDLKLQVYFNEDLESYNFNYTNNIEQMAQDKVILSSDGTMQGDIALNVEGV